MTVEQPYTGPYRQCYAARQGNAAMQRYTSTIILAAVLSAVGCARRFVTATLRQWGRADLIETAELLTSELVTNAVRATGVLKATIDPDEFDELNMLRIQIEARDSSTFVSVWDCDPTMPVAVLHDLDDERGCGLLLVDAMSKRWSCYPSPAGGKVVWFELGMPTTGAGLPKRTWRTAIRLPTEVMCDRAMLLRVRDALTSL